jgi:hypothetical protein
MHNKAKEISFVGSKALCTIRRENPHKNKPGLSYSQYSATAEELSHLRMMGNSKILHVLLATECVDTGNLSTSAIILGPAEVKTMIRRLQKWVDALE